MLSFLWSSALAATCPSHDLDAGAAIDVAVTGWTCGQRDEGDGSCGYVGAEDYAVRWTAPVSGRYALTTAGSAFDTVLYVEEASGCAELACNDDDPRGGVRTSTVELDAVAGRSYVVTIDGFAAGDCGDFRLTIDGPTQLEVTPIVAGQPFTASVTAATPFAPIYLFGSAAPGLTCHPTVPDLCLDLAAPRLVAQTVVDASGEATFPLVAPARLPATIHLQTATFLTGEPSNVWIQ